MLQELKKNHIPEDFPVQLVQLPARVHTFCENVGCKTLGDLVRTSGSSDYETLLSIPGFGKEAAGALHAFFAAINAGDMKGLRHYLPIDPKVKEISLPQTLLDLVSPIKPKDVELLRMRLEDRSTLAAVGQRLGCTRERVRQKEESFLQKLGIALEWFSKERDELWRTWQSEGELQTPKQARRIAPASPWLLGAIGAIFERSQEGQALEQSLLTSFPQWAAELLAEPGLDSSGVSLDRFLKGRTKLECTRRFESWLRANLGNALTFPGEQRVKRGAPELTVTEKALLYSGQINERRWERMYFHLEQYHATHGNAHVPVQEDPQLGRWINTQRQRRARGEMPEDQISRLDRLGFKWRFRHERRSWEEYLKELRAFKAIHGHCDVPVNYRKDPWFGRYANTLRWLRRKGKLPKERVAALDALGFEWKGPLRGEVQIGAAKVTTEWHARFTEFLAFKAVHCHCNVPTPRRPKLTSLGRWVLQQRKRKRQGDLPPEIEHLLTEQGFPWSGR